jgi:hypothetical protein
MQFPGILDGQLLAIDSGVLSFLVLSWLLGRRYHNLFLSILLWVLTRLFAYTLVLTFALTVILWSFKGLPGG